MKTRAEPLDTKDSATEALVRDANIDEIYVCEDECLQSEHVVRLKEGTS